MSAKQQTGNVAAPVDNGEVVRIMDDDARIVRPKPRASNATKKNRINNNNSNNTGVPLVSNVEDTPPNVVFDQPNRPHVQQPYMAHSCRPNMTHPVVIGNMPVHNPPPSTCWCNGISDDIRAIKETLNSVSNGIHLILQKVHMDQMNNAQMMSQILRTVEMVADTVNNMSFVQFQAYDQYYDGSGVGNPTGSPDGTVPPETCYEQTDEQNTPIEHVMNNSSRSYP
uniref:Bm9846 n=1 Tax=Brugia malayi TaxID=6279 RepID=A0A0J9XUR7_BRUMA|nr:Bm9846 [Brugia malayi]